MYCTTYVYVCVMVTDNIEKMDVFSDHHGPPKVNCWKEPMNPAQWKEEHVSSLI